LNVKYVHLTYLLTYCDVTPTACCQVNPEPLIDCFF